MAVLGKGRKRMEGGMDAGGRRGEERGEVGQEGRQVKEREGEYL